MKVLVTGGSGLVGRGIGVNVRGDELVFVSSGNCDLTDLNST